MPTEMRGVRAFCRCFFLYVLPPAPDSPVFCAGFLQVGQLAGSDGVRGTLGRVYAGVSRQKQAHERWEVISCCQGAAPPMLNHKVKVK